MNVCVQCGRWMGWLAVAGLLAAAVACEHTVTEPGEVEHGGVFLHASARNATTEHYFTKPTQPGWPAINPGGKVGQQY
jgi:hypothetical protein